MDATIKFLYQLNFSTNFDTFKTIISEFHKGYRVFLASYDPLGTPQTMVTIDTLGTGSGKFTSHEIFRTKIM